MPVREWKAMREFERSKGLIEFQKWPKVLVPVACRCGYKPYAHIHEWDVRKWEVVP